MATKKDTSLSIVIVNWNTCDLLADCLASVDATAGDLTLEVIVVDNASSDDSVARVREQFPKTQLIINRENVGFARANNQGIAASHAPFVLLLNSDTIVHSNALQEIVALMRAKPQVGIVGANIVNPDGSPQRCYGKFPTILSESIYAWGLDSRLPIVRWNGLQNGSNSETVETDWVLGAALTVRRDALAQVGLLDEEYFMYSEEVDLCYRVKCAGWQNFVLRTARVTHLGGQSTRQIPAKMKAHLFQSKVRYFRKHHGPVTANLMKMVFAVSILSRQMGYRLRGQTDKSNLWTEAWVFYQSKGNSK